MNELQNQNPNQQVVALGNSDKSSLQTLDKTLPSISARASASVLSQGDGLTAEYYDNIDFTNLKKTRIDATVNFDWGLGSPDSSVNENTFSARWTGQVEAKYSETYNFYTTSDDGVRLSVNGQQIINKFVDQSPTENSGSIALVAGQKYDIKLEYYENTSQAVSKLAWSSASQTKEIIPQSQLYSKIDASANGNGNGLKAEYYDNIDFTNLKVTRTDATVNNDWAYGSPDPSIGADTFSARWTGQVQAKYSETYNFYTTADDGVRLSVNGQQIINQFINQSATESVGSIALIAGQKYDIKLEYFENTVTAVSKLAWSSATQTKEIIPQSQLYSQNNIPASGSGNGLKAEYYDNIDFTNLKVTRTDATVNNDWAYGSPDPSIGADTFSARWTGQVQAKYSETYNFYTTADDGVRLSVNGQQIINQFINQSATESVGSIALIAGQKYDIKLEYFENTVTAVSKLAWSSATQTKEIIPQSQLYSPALQATITLGSSSTTVNEGAGNVTITLLRSGDLSSTSSIKYATLAGTATAGVDYGTEGTESAGTIIFAPGESSRQVSILINDDSLAEADETFNFVIDQAGGATLGLQRTLGITIQDNDRSDIDFTAPVINEGNGTATVTATRGNTVGAASVDYTTVDGTAKAGSDYQTVSATLSFAAGQASKTIVIPIINDNVGESNETFTLKFSNAVGVQLTNQQTTITILDDDSGKFTIDTLASGLNQPTAFDWTSDQKRMFVAQKNGVVRVLDNGKLLATPFIDISGQVNDTRDRGLLGIAVHPDFGKSPTGNNYVYLVFTYDPPETNPSNSKNNPNSTLDNPDQNGNRSGRLIRVTADPNTNYTTAIAGSEVVLLGKNSTWDNIVKPDGNSTNVSLDYAPSGIVNKDTGKPFTSLQDYLNNLDKVQNIQNFIASDSESHSVGSVRFGTDGSLFVSIGDGTSYNGVDPRAIRVQSIDNLSGKILHIDAITGQGLSSNPFYNGDPDSNRSKVYNLGLRNPFRFTIDKKTNTPVIGDVGFATYEEVNIGKPGANFGWPFYEGGLDANSNIVNLQQPKYSTLDAAKDFYSSGATVTAPVYTYKHFGSNSIVMGDFYTGNTFPSIYQGALFVGDFSQGTIDALKFDSQGKLVSVKRFASQSDTPNLGVPTQLTTGLDGNLYYANLTGGEIDRFRSV
ncbi:MAG: PQQ-dependent sugar dehydrogenase [Nostoc sp. NMS1]|uniref:PA14 domain-containing protein n=1 Tax=unclassified Nostoc TaxID=2593658 RepID=UPI0025DC89C3|nr:MULTISPECIES: PA14 domain-containing protein [unclassified Nostoc]MBN3906546.1 PQQ-dependent sugar dehydrogenase [Nostoc sp. NMS1]MBN3993069.1 PQQ-dependent sugar dehydrogenase [Nostoc sp. NMS2]